MASFEVGWPKKFYLIFFGLVSTWLALKNSNDLLMLKKFPL